MTSHAQSILCFSAEDSTSIKSFDVFAASDDFKSIEKRIESTNFKNYVGKAICVKTQGFADTCFYLKYGVNAIHLNLHSSTLPSVQIDGSQTALSEFSYAIKEYIKSNKSKSGAVLTYNLSVALRSEDSTLFENIQGELHIETNKFSRKKKHHQLNCSSLVVEQTYPEDALNSDLDSSNILNPLAFMIDECFWNYKSDWEMILARVQEKRPWESININKYDSIIEFHLERHLNNSIDVTKHTFTFDNNYNLLQIESNNPNFIYPIKFVGEKKRNIKYCRITYPSDGTNFPKLISLVHGTSGKENYTIETRLELKNTQDKNSNQPKYILPYNWPYSTLAWLRHHGITVKNG